MHIISPQSEGLLDGQHQAVDGFGNGGEVISFQAYPGFYVPEILFWRAKSGVGDTDKGSGGVSRYQ